MNKIEFLKSLTKSQRTEFDNDIEAMILEMAKTKNLYSDKLHEVNTNMRLENKIFLNVTLGFNIDENGKVNGSIIDIIKFNNVDEYLDSINSSKQSGDSWVKIK